MKFLCDYFGLGESDFVIGIDFVLVLMIGIVSIVQGKGFFVGGMVFEYEVVDGRILEIGFMFFWFGCSCEVEGSIEFNYGYLKIFL